MSEIQPRYENKRHTETFKREEGSPNRGAVAEKYDFMKDQQGEFSVSAMSRFFRLPRS